jgi:undecaprenyl-diphosphatase
MRISFMDLFFKTITWAGSGLVLFPLAALIAGILWFRGRGADALLVSGGLLGCFLLVHGLKHLFARPRPAMEDMLVTVPAGFSFPSAHTAQAAAFALACAMAFGRDAASAAEMLTWGCLGLAALLVGISRIYLHVHYVSDVIAGAVLGLAWVLALNRLLKWAVHRI